MPKTQMCIIILRFIHSPLVFFSAKGRSPKLGPAFEHTDAKCVVRRSDRKHNVGRTKFIRHVTLACDWSPQVKFCRLGLIS